MIFFHLIYDNPRENRLPVEIQPFPGYNNMHPRWDSNPQPWIKSPTRLSIAPRSYMRWDMIGFSIFISCYNFPIIIACFNCILKIYSPEDILWLPWRNWLARSAVTRKVGGSGPPGSDYLSDQHIHLHTFLHDHYFGSYGCLNTIDRQKKNY